ncbi:MAG: hypothetical protein Q9195_008089 [Heterodermia aff. obscurata]
MALLIDGVAVVTGAGSGIGRECALAYAAEGARGVVLADRNYDAALVAAHESELIATHPTYKAKAIAVDVSDRASVDEMVQAAVHAFGRIDYSVNSAGVGVQKHLHVEDADAAEMNRFWQVNVMGTFNCVQAVTKVMKEQSVVTVSSRGRAREVGRGVILNLGSCNSYIATRDIVQYTTTKHAVMGLTKNADAAMDGNPNLEKMIKGIIPMSRIARPEEIADVVLFMTSPRSSYVTGVGWIVDGGTTLQVQTC